MKPNKIIIFTALIFLLFFVWIIFVLGVSDDTANTKIEGKVYSELEKNTEVNVVLFLDEKKDQKVSQHSVKIDSFKNKKIIDSYRNSITIKVSKSELELLSKDNSVKKIILPRKVKAFLQDSVPLINVTRVWPLRVNSINITGNSETVCIIDTGINFSHPDLIGKNKTCIIDCFNKNCVENCSLSDDNGHGTHVAGIVAASGGIAGVAFNANLIGVKVLNSSGSGSGRDSDIPEAIDWCVDNRAAYNISVISMSLGTETVYEGDCGSPADSWTISINNAIVKNISVVAASGNSGNGVPRNTTHISAPACIGNVTAVSATDKSDSLSTYGHYGPRVKLVAPGTNINSTWLNGMYVIESGTSMATPHVSGAIAVINQFLRLTNQTKTPRQIEITLNSTGKIINAPNGLNFSRINLYNATISLDIQQPNISLILPSANLTTLNTSLTFRCNASDLALKNITFYLWNSSGVYNQTSASANSASHNFEINISNFSEEDYKWNCLYTDENNNRAFASANYTFSILSIHVSLISPANYLATKQNQTYTCNASSNRGLSNASLLIWNSSNLVYNASQNISGTFNQTSFSYNLTQDGNYSWNCLFTNNASSQKSASSNYSIFFDVSNPNVTLAYPPNNSLARVNTTFRCNASDLALKNMTFYLWNSSALYYNYTETISGTNNNFEINLSLADDNYRWNCLYYDYAGNLNSNPVNYTLRKTPKQVILIGVDGLQLNRFNSLLNSGNLTNFSRLITGGGRSSYANITGHASTETAPGNAELHTGLNETLNNVSNNGGGVIPSGNTTFERLKNFNLSIKTGFIYGKTTSYIPNTILTNALAQIDWAHNKTTFNNSNWPDNSPTCTYSGNVSTKAAEFISNYSNNSFYLVVYFGNPDCTGHIYGDNSLEYNLSIIDVDNGLGVLLNSLESAGLRGQDNITQIIVTADHGWNTATMGHGTSAIDTIMIPLISNNASMIANATSDRVREQCEIAPTILNYFGFNRSSYQDIINNGCESLIGDGVPPLVTINYPASSYTSLPIPFNVTLNEVGLCNYTLNFGINNRTMASSDNLTFTASESGLSDGTYNVTYYCWDISDNFNGSARKSFTMSTPSQNTGGGGGGGGGGAATSQTYYVANANMKEEGYMQELAKSDRIIIEIENSQKTYENHTITADYIGPNSVNLTISSDPIKIYLLVGQDVKLNFSSADYYELSIKLKNIINNKANLTIKSIHEAISAPLQGTENKSLAINSSESNKDNLSVSEKNKSNNKVNIKTLMKILAYMLAVIFVIGLVTLVMIKIRKFFEKRKIANKKR